MSRPVTRLRALEQERDKLAELLAQRFVAIGAAAEAQRDLATARGRIVELRQELDHLRAGLDHARREHERLEQLLRRTQDVARGYAAQLDAAERRRRAAGWWRRLFTAGGGSRVSPSPIQKSQPGTTACQALK